MTPSLRTKDSCITFIFSSSRSILIKMCVPYFDNHRDHLFYKLDNFIETFLLYLFFNSLKTGQPGLSGHQQNAPLLVFPHHMFYDVLITRIEILHIIYNFWLCLALHENRPLVTNGLYNLMFLIPSFHKISL